jgi:hypothetical protein
MFESAQDYGVSPPVLYPGEQTAGKIHSFGFDKAVYDRFFRKICQLAGQKENRYEGCYPCTQYVSILLRFVCSVGLIMAASGCITDTLLEKIKALCPVVFDPIRGNEFERLEFLGDAVLELAVSSSLLKNDMFTLAAPSVLSEVRQKIINNSHLAMVFDRLQLGHHIQISNDAVKTKADCIEAILGELKEEGSPAAAAVQDELVMFIIMMFYGAGLV